MAQIDLTIAIPVYNSSSYIEKTLRSALRQQIQNLEILILNDYSTDNTIEVIQRIAKEYCVMLSIYNADRNSGVGVMRNKAIELAGGDYLFFLDSDDFLAERSLEKMLAKAREFDADMVIGSHVDVCDNVEHIIKEENRIFVETDAFASYAFKNRYGYAGGVWNKLIKTELLRQKAVTFPDYRVGEDVPFIFKLITVVKRVVLMDEITYRYVIRPGSLCQYNPRDFIPKAEVQTHVKSKILLKKILLENANKTYYMSMLSIVMDYCLDTIRVMIEKRNILEERVPPSIIRQIMQYPATISEVIQYGGIHNFFNYVLCHMPYTIVSSYFITRKFLKDIL